MSSTTLPVVAKDGDAGAMQQFRAGRVPLTRHAPCVVSRRPPRLCVTPGTSVVPGVTHFLVPLEPRHVGHRWGAWCHALMAGV